MECDWGPACLCVVSVVLFTNSTSGRGVLYIQGDETVTLCSLQELTLWGGVLSGEKENKSRQERILISRARVSESGGERERARDR